MEPQRHRDTEKKRAARKREQERRSIASLLVLSLPLFSVSLCLCGSTLVADEPKRLDPAAWGSDHVGKPVPEYTTGDECLFCHREKIGAKWGENRHNLTIRPLDPDSPAGRALKEPPAKEFADAVKFVMGGQHRQRFLK